MSGLPLLFSQIKKQFVEYVEAMRNTPQAFRMVWASSKWAAVLSFILTVISAVLPAAQAWAGKLIIDSILNAVNAGLSADEGLRQIFVYLGLELALVLVNTIVNQGRSLTNSILQMQLTNHINTQILNKAISLDLQFFEDPVFYDALQNARRRADSSALSIVDSVLQILQQIITMITLVVILTRFSFWLAVIVVVTAIPNFLSQSQFAERAFRAVTRRAPESRLLNYLEMLLTGSDTVKEIKLFGLGSPLLERYQNLFSQFYMEDRAIAERRTISGFGWGLLANLAYYASYAWIVFRTVAGAITLGDMSMFLSIFRQSQHSIRSLLESFNRLYENNLFLDNLITYLALKPKLTSPKNAKPIILPINKGIEFIDVSFRYPGSEKLVLQNINLHIKPSERIALIGLNGAGKTTLIKLLTRLYDPTSGQILIDGVDLRKIRLGDLHQLFGVIFQDYVRYQLSVRENIGFGQIDALSDFQRIKQAAEKGGAAPLIEKMKEGYDTILGRRWDHGIDLSGGQWQKIALARAFMRNAQVLILDEPTAALDAEAEYEVFKRFGELVGQKIAVLISHRFSTVRMADRIVVLSEGKIIELGSHEELIREKGAYSRLFNLQAEGYR